MLTNSWTAYLLLFMLTISSNTLFAQFTDSFSDGDFTSNPSWQGDVDQFIVNDQFVLQSFGDTISSSNAEIYLSTPSESMNDTQWEFFVNPRVSTSSNNRIDVFLASDIADLTGDNKGYFVRIGGTPDEVALFRKDGIGQESYIINGVAMSINSSSTNPTRVKVTRDASGNFTLFADYEGTGNLYELIGSQIDDAYTQSAFFGVLVRYSNGNRERYNADDFYVGPIIVDNTPPSLIFAKVINSNTLQLRFSENVTLETAENTENYFANNNLGEPIAAQRDPNSFSRVNLTFGADFQNGVENTLTVTAIEDLSENDMDPESINFLYYLPQPFDIVINEIFADPTPTQGLPEVEYVELFNRTSYPIDLEDWILEAGTNKKVVPPITILPDSFLVLSNLAGEEFMFDTVAVAGLSSFPALTNSGARLTLYMPDTSVMSTVSYSIAWYGNSAKEDGGFSLEQISPFKPCEGKPNWRASEVSWGGTPGKRNSVYNAINDEVLPEINRITVIASDTIRVFFSEPILEESMLDIASYSVDQGVGNPVFIKVNPPNYSSVILAFEEPFSIGTVYELNVISDLLDCVGNSFDTESIGRFAIPEQAQEGDIVINEVLTNPYESGSDFVELYNLSNKVIDLASLQLSKWDTIVDVAEDAELITEEGYLLFPGEFILLSDDIENVKENYFTSNPDGFLEVLDMPSYNNDDGIVTLARLGDQVKIDELIYTTDLHYALVDDLDGVSLERVNPRRPASDKTNWNSAASTVGYATPGYQNSQFGEFTQSQAGSLTLTPELFSPDGDGFDDILTISYAFDLPGFTGSIWIYDSNGREVKNLSRNQLLGTEGQISWNGETDDNAKARLGIYIIYMEAFDLQGNIVKIKKVCVLGGKL